MSERELGTVVLTLDNDFELECAILCIFDYNDRKYIALFPQGDNEYAKTGEVFIYRYIEATGNSEPELENILDDEEFENVSNIYDDIVYSMSEEEES